MLIASISILIAISGVTVFMISSDTSSDLSITSDDRYITTLEDWSGHLAPGVDDTIPVISFDLPSEIRVGEPFEINVPYTYVGFDDGEVDWIIELHKNHQHSSIWDPDHPGTIFGINYPEEWELLNDPELDIIREDYSPNWQHIMYHTGKIIRYDITQEHNIKLIFNMTQPVEYPREKFSLGVGFIYSDYYLNNHGDYYKPSLIREPPQFAPGQEPQPPCPECTHFGGILESEPNFDPMRPDMETEYSIIINNFDDLLEYGGYETIEEYIRDTTALDWAEEFLEKYPEFRTQSINLDTISNFLLPSAYGQTQYVSVSGKVVIQDDKGRFLAPNTPITACLVDENLITSNNQIYTVLKNGLSNACKEIGSDGTFTLFADGGDPNNNNSQDRADVAVRFHLDNSKIKLVKNNGDKFSYFYSTTINDHTNNILRFSTIKINNSDDIGKSYQVFDKINDGYKHFERLGYNDIPPVTVQYQSGVVMDVGWSYQNDRIKLQDTSTKDLFSHPFMILHEFGHHIQNSVYDKHGSSTPHCGGVLHHANLLTDENCAWGEGWATFVGLWVEDQSTFSSFTTSNVIDYELGTFDGETFPTTSPKITEGWVTSALLDVVDTTNERGDNMSGESQKLWNAFKNNKSTHSYHNLVAGSINEFRADWDAERYPNLQSILELNHLANPTHVRIETTPTTTPPTTTPPTTTPPTTTPPTTTPPTITPPTITPPTITPPTITPPTITPPTITPLLHENFESGLGSWVLTNEDDVDWFTSSETLPNGNTPNKIGLAYNCDNTCTMTSDTLNISADSQLIFTRYVSSSIDNNEGLRVDISNNGGTTWQEIAFYSDNNDKDDDTWHDETFSLDGSSTFKIRFVALASSSSEKVKLDNIIINGPIISGTSTGVLTTVFSDNFIDLSKWTKSGELDWTVNPTVWYEKRPSPITTFASAKNCDNECIITSDDIDLSGYNNATLSLKRFVDKSADSGEYLKVQLYNGVNWDTVFTWGQDTQTDDDTWHDHSLDISSYVGISDFKVRFVGLVSSASEQIAVTDVTVQAVSGNTSTPPITETPDTIISNPVLLEESFDNLDRWTSTDTERWFIVSSWNEGELPSESSSNKFAVSNGCRNSCTLSLTSDIDLSNVNTATLEIMRYVDKSLDRGEYLKIQVYDGNSWVDIGNWGADNRQDTDTWESESVNISEYLNDEFSIKIISKMSSSREDVGIDTLRIIS